VVRKKRKQTIKKKKKALFIKLVVFNNFISKLKVFSKHFLQIVLHFL